MASFDFFRRHQKIILYTAGIFALVTFSVTGAMTAVFEDLTRPTFKGPTMVLADGRHVSVLLEDHQIAQAIVNTEQRLAQRLGLELLLPPVIPAVGDRATDARSNRTEILAALRRLAIEYGIEASDDEAELAVQTAAKVFSTDIQPGEALPRVAGIAGCTPGEYLALMRESLRISTFMRLFAFAADTSDAQLAEKIVREMKLLTMRVATLDKKAMAEKLAQTEVTDDELRAWLEALPEAEKAPYQDTNRVALRLAGLKLADFDPAAFAAELEGKEYPDSAVEDRYNLDREVWYRREKKEGEEPPQDPYVPLADVKDQILARLKVEDVLKSVLEKVRAAMAAHLRPAVEARTAANQEWAEAKEKLAAAEKAAAEKPDDAALKDEVTSAKAAATAAEEKHKAAAEAVDAARKTFDLHAALPEATTGKLVTAAVAEPKNADELKELPEFGTWDASWSAASVELEGDLGSRVQNTKTGAFIFQAAAIEKSPLKDFEKIRDQVKEGYFQKKADEAAKEQLAKFDAARERLAREARKTEIEAAEAEHTAEVTKEFEAWQSTQQAAITRAEQMVESLASDPQSVAYQQWAARKDSLEREIADAEGKRKAIEAEQRTKTDEKIETILREANKQVLADAAAEAGLTVETVGPYRKDLDQMPRFQESYPSRVRFLFGQQAVKDLEEGDSSKMLEDPTNRAHHLVVMEKIEPGTLAHVTRRELATQRAQFVAERAVGAVQQSFSLEALRQGWGYRTVDTDVAKSGEGEKQAGMIPDPPKGEGEKKQGAGEGK